MLKFIGSGSCFNTKLGNNSAYFIENNDLFLLDCGGDVFPKIKYIIDKNNFNNINVFITHPHSDHIGSLPDLIFYAYFVKQQKIILICPDLNIIKLLQFMGVAEDFYNFEYQFGTIENNYYFKNNYVITPHMVKHDPRLNGKCFGFEFRSKDFKFYYSGDSCNIPKDIINELEQGEIDIIYQDVSSQDYEGNIHLSFKQLKDLIKPEYRNKVYLMHLDEMFDKDRAKYLGFNLVENEIINQTR